MSKNLTTSSSPSRMPLAQTCSAEPCNTQSAQIREPSQISISLLYIKLKQWCIYYVNHFYNGLMIPVLTLGESSCLVYRVQADQAITMCFGMTTTSIQMNCSASPINYATRTFAALVLCPSLLLPTTLTLWHSVPVTILLKKNMTGKPIN